MKKLLAKACSGTGRRVSAIAAVLALSCGGALAQISVGAAGSAVQTFNSLPAVTEWSTLGIGTDHQYADGNNDEADTDAAIQAVDAPSISGAITASTGNPPGTLRTGQWSSSGQYLYTRPTGNGACIVMATLRNDSGGDLTTLSISYDLAVLVAPGTERIPGHRLYYSFTGAANSWVVIGNFGNAGAQNPTVDLSATPWTAGTTLYLLFVDNNTDLNPDGGYSIDNFAITLPGIPPSIVQQPSGVTNGEYSVVTLSVGASGSPPLTYQWFKNGNPISGATTPTFVVTNTDASGHAWSVPTDTGNYTVTVTGSANPPVTSSSARVVILADTNAPRFSWALATTNDTGGTTIQVHLSEAVSNPQSDYGEVLNWVVNKVSGPGGSLDAPDSVQITNNDIYLVYSAAQVDPATTYRVEYSGPALSDFAQTPNQQTVFTVPVLAHTADVLPLNAVWKYNDTVTSNNTPANWFTTGFDDTDATLWKAGPGPFDSKRDANGAAGMHCRDTTLYGLGNVGTCINRTNELTGQTNAVVFFRTHFTFSGSDPTNAALLLNGKFDDGAIVYLNGVELERVGVPSGNLSWTAFTTSRTVGDTDPQDTATIFPGNRLVAGDNVVAVELHQQSDTSSDMTMGLHIVAATVEPAPTGGGGNGPTLHIARNGTTGEISISWSGAGTLQQTTDLGPTASWSNVTGTSPYTFTPAAGAGHLFFRVQQ